MNRPDALKILGLEHAMPDLTPDIVLEAFRSRVKLVHPDTAESRSESNLTQVTVQELTMAKKTLLESLDGTDLCCRLCNGRGRVRASIGSRTCVACDGKGERK